MGDSTRALAFFVILVFLFGTLIGSVLPEFGNVLQNYFGNARAHCHDFNVVFLVIGVAGVCLALYLGYKVCC